MVKVKIGFEGLAAYTEKDFFRRLKENSDVEFVGASNPGDAYEEKLDIPVFQTYAQLLDAVDIVYIAPCSGDEMRRKARQAWEAHVAVITVVR